MSSSQHFAIMSVQSLENNYHEVCHNYLLYSAISAVVSGDRSLCIYSNVQSLPTWLTLILVLNTIIVHDYLWWHGLMVTPSLP